jgi:hypothetical protein
MSGFKIVKTTYSASPWRIVDADGKQVRFETETVFMHGADRSTLVCGYDTKTEAVEALGRLAAILSARVKELQDTLASPAAAASYVSNAQARSVLDALRAGIGVITLDEQVVVALRQACSEMAALRDTELRHRKTNQPTEETT